MTDLETLAFARQIIAAHNGHMRRLADATALLERCRTGEATDSEIADFLSPAQPAAPAPTPDLYAAYPCVHGGQCYCVPLCVPLEEPAAPEPSATVPESMHIELREVMLSERRAKESAEAQLADAQRMAEERKEAWLAACAKLESTRDVLRLARATGSVPALVCAQLDACLQPDTTPLADAEAQLAAVRKTLEAVRKIAYEPIVRGNWKSLERRTHRIRAYLTPAPSPGAALDGACYCSEYQSSGLPCPEGK